MSIGLFPPFPLLPLRTFVPKDKLLRVCLAERADRPPYAACTRSAPQTARRGALLAPEVRPSIVVREACDQRMFQANILVEAQPDGFFVRVRLDHDLFVFRQRRV